MSEVHAKLELNPAEQQAVDSAVILCKLKMLARQVPSNEHFYKILMYVAPSMRKQVYAEIKPHLLFKPKPYFLLMKG